MAPGPQSPANSELPEGPWVRCPRCLGVVSLGRFFPGDDEPGTAFAVCPACATHVTLLSPEEPR